MTPLVHGAFAPFIDDPRWVAYNDKKWPVNPHTGRMGSTTDRRTWGTYALAVDAMRRYQLPGIGIVLGDGLAGIDLDHIAPGGAPHPWAVELIAKCGSYAEWSPSGEGIHILALVTEERKGRELLDYPAPGMNVEAYTTGRFLTVTGRQVEGSADSIGDANQVIADLYNEMGRVKSERGRARQSVPAASGRSLGHEMIPYVREAVACEVEDVAATPRGGRNNRLNRAAFALGQLVGSGVLNEATAIAELHRAAAACGHTADHGIRATQATIESGLNKGKALPRDLSQVRILKPAEPSGVELRPTPSESKPTALPIVNTGDRQLSDLTGQALQVLNDANDPPVLYVRSGAVVRVRRDEEGRPIIDKAGPDVIVERMGKVANWVSTKMNGKAVAARPPQHVAVNILAGGVWPFPALQGIAEAPFLRPDGSVVTRPGYDPATKLLYIPSPGLTVPPIPAKPTPAEITQALDAVWTPISEFPFADDASMAGALAMMLSPIMRPAIRGCTPMALVDAPQAGTGKSLLTEVVSLVSTGRAAAMLSAPDTDAEWEKRITAVLAGGATFICIDNIEQPLSAPSLAKVLTSETHQGRILGESTMVNLPQRATWVGTGNNISLRGDLARRCYWVRLDAASSRPWTREGFRIPDLRKHIADHRGELLAALLTLARAWFDAGCPRPTTPRLGSFEAWCDAIGGTLELAGVPAFLGNIEDLWNRDDDAQEWEAFLRAWFAQFGDEPQTVREVADTIDGISAGELREALPATLVNQSGEVNRRSFGRQLAKRAEMRFGDDGIHIRKAKTDQRTQKPRWQVAMS